MSAVRLLTFVVCSRRTTTRDAVPGCAGPMNMSRCLDCWVVNSCRRPQWRSSGGAKTKATTEWIRRSPASMCWPARPFGRRRARGSGTAGCAGGSWRRARRMRDSAPAGSSAAVSNGSEPA